MRGSGLIDWVLVGDALTVLSNSFMLSAAVVASVFITMLIGDFVTAIMHKLHSVFVPYRV